MFALSRCMMLKDGVIVDSVLAPGGSVMKCHITMTRKHEGPDLCYRAAHPLAGKCINILEQAQ